MAEPEVKTETAAQAEPEITPKELLNELIDPQRVEQIEQTNQQLLQKVGELESTVRRAAQPQGQATWDKVTDDQLEYVSTHPLEYPQHAAAALQEIRRRDRETIRSQVISEIGSKQVIEEHKEAFDPNTPIGKEVSKIMSAGRNQKDVLSDVIELAKFRVEGVKGEEKGRKQAVGALKAAAAHAPGSESAVVVPAPSFMEMPKDQFEKEVEKIKTKGFK